MIDSALAKGRDLPPWALNEPPMFRGDDFFLMAFFDLSTCRALSDSGPGPIPWTAIIEYSDRAMLELDVEAGFVRIIRALDFVYLEWYAKKIKEMQKVK
jgi:hypothetical protein